MTTLRLTHTPACTEKITAYFERAAALNAARAEAKARYPRFCPQCEGMGISWDYDGDTGYEDFDVCACLSQGFCPRCGADGMEVNEDCADIESLVLAPCAACGWIGGKGMEIPQNDADLTEEDLCACSAVQDYYTALELAEDAAGPALTPQELNAMLQADLHRYEMSR